MEYFGFDRPSFGIKTFGFGESSPKLQADFTTETYKADGVDKTFADLFTFNRAGKAWLVKETGLQEYAADVPRLDDGLLIEQSATNVTKYSIFQNGADTFDPKGGGYSIGSSDLHSGKAITAVIGTYLYYKTPSDSNISDTICTSYILSKTDGSEVLVGNNSSFDIRFAGAANEQLVTRKITSEHYVASALYDSGTGGGLSRLSSSGGDVIVHSIQSELGTRPTSLIMTEATPVTRPADFLLNKITGTTVTGDWDSTLNLSIVNGQLVHSGYGRIRSLEIN